MCLKCYCRKTSIVMAIRMWKKNTEHEIITLSDRYSDGRKWSAAVGTRHICMWINE